MLTVLILAGAASLALLRGEPNLYLLYWRDVVGAAIVVLTVMVLLEAVAGGGWSTPSKAWSAILVSAVAVGAIMVGPASGTVQKPYARMEPIVQSMLAQLRRAGQPNGAALIRPWGDTMLGVAAALLDQMLKAGRPVYVDRSLGYEVGYGRTATLPDVHWVLFVIENSAIYNVARTLPDARVVAVNRPLPAAEMDELARLQERVLSELRANRFQGDYQLLGAPLVDLLLRHSPGVSAADLEELSRLNTAVAAHGCLCSVIEFPANPGLTYQPGYMASIVTGGREDALVAR